MSPQASTPQASTQLSFWFVRKRETGEFIPFPPGPARGGSFVEPCLPNPAARSTTPRFFRTQRCARNFLLQWLKGKHVRKYEGESGDAWVEVVPVKGRHAGDYEIVEGRVWI